MYCGSLDAAGPTMNLLDRTNTSRDVTARHASASPNYIGGTCWIATKAGENNDGYGIIIGSDNTTPTNDDYDLGASIDDGSGAGEILHGPHSVVPPYEDGQSIKWELSRTFNNQSGDTVTVREIGMVTKTHYGQYNVNTFGEFLVARDVFSDVDVGDEETIQVTYVLETSIDESA
jgi:hypothetical protein